MAKDYLLDPNPYVTTIPSSLVSAPRQSERLRAILTLDELSSYAVECIEDFSERIGLTQREEAVLACVVRGFNYDMTAEVLNISENTVKTHVRNLLAKSECRSSSELISRIFMYVHSSQPLRRKRLLWIDDYPANNSAVLELLRQHGLDVDLAIDTWHALDRLRAYPYTLIISDFGRGSEENAGLTMFDVFREAGVAVPPVVYFASENAVQLFSEAALRLGAIGVFCHTPELIQLLYDQKIL